MRLKCAVRLGPSLKYLGFSVLPGFEREREIDVERIRTLGFSSFFFFFLSKELEASLERGWKSGGNFFKMARKMMVFDQSRKVHAFSRIFHSPVAISRRSSSGCRTSMLRNIAEWRGGRGRRRSYGCVEMVFAASRRKKQFSTFP